MSKNIVRKCDKITIFILILLQDFHYNNFVASKGKAQAANSVGYCVVTGVCLETQGDRS